MKEGALASEVFYLQDGRRLEITYAVWSNDHPQGSPSYEHQSEFVEATLEGIGISQTEAEGYLNEKC